MLGAETEETFAEVIHGAPGVLIRELRWILICTLKERPKRTLDLQIIKLVSRPQEKRKDRLTATMTRIYRPMGGFCALSRGGIADPLASVMYFFMTETINLD